MTQIQDCGVLDVLTWSASFGISGLIRISTSASLLPPFYFLSLVTPPPSTLHYFFCKRSNIELWVIPRGKVYRCAHDEGPQMGPGES